MAAGGAIWSKVEISALIDAYSEAKTSADPITTESFIAQLKASLQKHIQSACNGSTGFHDNPRYLQRKGTARNKIILSFIYLF